MQEEEKKGGEITSEDTKTNESIPEVEEKSTGAIIGAIIIVVLLVIGGLYFLGQRVNKELAPEEILSQPDEITEVLGTQGSSDEIIDITTDLGSESDFGNLDVELGTIDAELNF